MFRKAINHFVLRQVAKSDDAQISQIIQAVISRYAEVYPGWDVSFLSLPKDPAQRRKQVQRLIDLLENNELQTENQR